MFKRNKKEASSTSNSLRRFTNRPKLIGAKGIEIVHTRIDNTSLGDWPLINLGSANRGYLKFLRPYVNTELQQTPNLSRSVKYNTSEIEMGLNCCPALTASEL